MMTIAQNLRALNRFCVCLGLFSRYLCLSTKSFALVAVWFLSLFLIIPSNAVAQSTSGAPTANAFGVSVLENSTSNTIASQTIGIVTGVQITTPPAHGTLVVSGLNFIYTPTTNYYGADSFFYTASNGAGVSAPARVSITVTQVIPTANAVTATLTINSTNNLINSNITGTANSITISSTPAHGSASVSGLNILYTPNAGYLGNDSFSYTATNTAGTSAPANVSITVNGLPPTANSVSTSVLQNSSANTISSNTSGGATSIAIAGSPSHGTASVSGLNIIYTPTSGYVGTDSFYYTASNAYGTSSIASVTITINGIPPIANSVSASVLQNSSVNSIASNITGSATSISLASSPTHGTVNISGMNFIYTPAAGYIGSDSFTYSATNSYGTSSIASVNVTVNGIPPTANSVSSSVLQDSANNAIASNTSGGATSLGLFSFPSHGTATISGMNILYTPTPGYVGTDSFKYNASNSYGTSNVASISININGIPPVANSVTAGVMQNSSTNVISSNITGSASSISLFSSPSHGSASVSGLSITYTPAAGYVGTDTFKYFASNAYGNSAVADISITVSGSPPVANPISISVAANSGNNATTANIAGSASSIAIGTPPAHGIASINGLDIIYVPTAGYTGSDTLTYTASNTYGTSAPASISVTVYGVLPVANPVNASVFANSSNNSIASGTTGASNLVITTAPLSGSASVNGLSLSYTPNPGFIGTDSFSYAASNAYGTSSSATATIIVKEVLPVVTAINISVSMNSNNNVINPIIAGTANNLLIANTPTHGNVSLNGLQMIYTPDANFYGEDSFSYQALNSSGGSNIATITISVKGLLPVARPINVSLLTNSNNNPISGNIIGDATSIVLTSSPIHGSVTVSGLTMSYTPQADFTGSDSFSYLAKNSFGSSAPALVSIQVNASTTLPLPIANPISSDVFVNSTANSIASNITGSYSQITIVKSTAHGTVSVSGNNFIYTPTKDYVGSDSFSYTASNASGSSNEAMVNINVKQAAPLAKPISIAIDINQTAAPIRADINGNVDKIVLESPPSHGSVTINGLEFRYTPALNFVGTDSFTYVAINASGSSSPATVSITVKAKAPVLSNATIQVLAGSSASLELANLVSQTGGMPVSFSILTQPVHGSATLSGTRLTVSAHLNYGGTDQLSIIANANGQASNTAVIAVTITARPDPSKNPAIQGLQTSKAAIINQFERLQLENFNARLSEIATQNSVLRNKEDKKNDDACNRVTLWAGGLNSFSTIATDYEIKQQNGGASFGGDRCLGSPDSVLGFGIGYANSRGELRGLNTTINANARNIANYGQFKPLPFFNFSWVLGINDISSDYTRTTEQLNDTLGWTAPPMAMFAGAPANTTQHNGKWTGRQKLGSTSVGFDVTFTAFKISPYLRLDRSAVTIAAYSESGDTRSALRYQEQSFNSQRTTLGMNAETVTKTRFGELTPRLRFEYQKDVGKRDDVKINYVDNPDSTPYVINGSKLNRNLIHMGVGGDLLLDSGWVIIFNYGYYRASEGNHSNAIRLRLSYRL